MAEQDRQEQIADGSTVEQEDARKLAELRSDLAAYATREKFGISETIFEATEIREPESLTTPPLEIGTTGPSETSVMDRKHPFHLTQVRIQVYIAGNSQSPESEEAIEELKRAA